MSNYKRGELIQASTAPKAPKTGRGRAYNDRTGEKRMMSCGQPATIIAYRSSIDMDIQFEDGAIATKCQYPSFAMGYVKHPNHELSGIHKHHTRNHETRTGESKRMHNGLIATITDYRGEYDIDIIFEDGTELKGLKYQSFRRGEISHPTIKTPRKQRVTEEDLKGLTNTMSNGMQGTIIAARSVKDIDVQFEDGEIAFNSTYNAFKSGYICHPSKKANRLGKEKVMSNGMICKIIAYRNSRDIDVCFEDGTEVYNRSYVAFQKGQIRNPSIQRTKSKKQNPANDDASQDGPETTGKILPNDEISNMFMEGIESPQIEIPKHKQKLQDYLELIPNNPLPNRTLLFEAYTKTEKGHSTFYYVEKDEDWYYFKYGISPLGAVIQPYEENRLNIISLLEEHYLRLKEDIFDTAGLYRWFGPTSNQYGYFNFLDENSPAITQEKCYELGECETPLCMLLMSHFEMEMEKVKKDPDGYSLINKFELNARECEVIHDKFYPAPNPATDYGLDEADKSNIAISFIQMSQGLSLVKDVMQTMSCQRRQLDLMLEALYLHEYKKYPQQLIVVEGWTAKDFIETERCDLIDTYSYLTLLRTDKEKGREEIRKKFYNDYPRVFDNELEKIYQARKTHREQENENTPAQNNTAPLDFTNMTSEQIMAAVFQDAHQQFLSTYTIPLIQNELKKYIMGQDDLIKNTASFIYYHVLRQVTPALPMRPLLISGPSGSGKTEVWRAAKKIFKNYLTIEIVDGSSITQDGWSGQRKLCTVLQTLNTATILVIDEFDKLATPSYTKGGDNVSQRIQSEFLKLLEGDYNSKGLRQDEDNQLTYDPSTLGIVLVGAFEPIRDEKEHKNDNVVGFIQHHKTDYEEIVPITDDDLMEFGVLPELVGRISTKCTTNKLTAEQYLEIIKGQKSKVSVLMQQLNKLGISTQEVLSDEHIIELAEQSQTNMLGVRWVSAQVENELLELLINADLRKRFAPQYKNHNIDI